MIDPRPTAIEVKVAVLERELELLRSAGRDDFEFRAEMRAFVAEQRALRPEHERRLTTAETTIKDLLSFKNKLLGAVAAAGIVGGLAGSVAAAIFRLLLGQ